MKAKPIVSSNSCYADCDYSDVARSIAERKIHSKVIGTALDPGYEQLVSISNGALSTQFASPK